MVRIRLFKPEDTQEIATLFHDTVRQVNIQDYSFEQVKAWAPDNIYYRDWLKICSSRFTYVAEANHQIIGFGQLERNGYIDCFYCHHQYQRQGVGSQIYAAIENKAHELNLTCLLTEASITAQSFFLSQGFAIVKEQKVSCRRQMFLNYLMRKQLKFLVGQGK